MKFIYFLFVLICINLLGCKHDDKKTSDSSQVSGKVTLSGAFALYPMAVVWKEEFNKVYPNIKIDISAGGAGKGMTDALSGMVDLGMISREISQMEVDKGAWYIPVVKDAVICDINSNNPVIKDIRAKGMTRECLIKIFITGEIKTWGEAIGEPSKCKLPIQIYTRSDACGAADIWAKYLGKKQEDLKGIGVFGDPGIAQAVQSDINGIGFNNIGFAFNPKSKKMNEKLAAVPLDLNNNNSIEPDEYFYDNLDDILNVINKNIYPSPPARDLYFVSKGKPNNESVKLFLNWILTEGQSVVKKSGYIELNNEKINLAKTKLK